MKSSIRNFIETNLIMLGLLFYCCEDTQPDSSDIIDAGVVINEINYNSLDSFDPDDWVEIYNSSNETIDLGSWLLKDDKDDHIFTIPLNTLLLPNQYLIFCTDTIKFTALFPDVNPYYGDLGFGLGGGGDIVRLFDYNGLLVDIVEYDDIAPWDTLADGSGATLELNHPSLDNTLGENWSASQSHGTPGAVNSAYNGYE